MLSNKPFVNPNLDLDQPQTSDFLSVNHEVLEQLATFIDFAPDRLALGFVSVNSPLDREVLIAALKTHPRSQESQLEVMDFPDPTLRFFGDELIARLKTLDRDPGKKLVLLITGLEKSIGMMGDYPPMLVDLNFIRDALEKETPHPLIFLLPDYALTRLARFAPDLWAWHMVVIKFQSCSETVDGALNGP